MTLLKRLFASIQVPQYCSDCKHCLLKGNEDPQYAKCQVHPKRVSNPFKWVHPKFDEDKIQEFHYCLGYRSYNKSACSDYKEKVKEILGVK